MSLYRETRRRRIWPLALAAVAGAAGGLLAGLLLAGSEEPDLAAAVEATREEVRPALGSLELVAIEYAEGGSEAQAATSHLESARAAFEAAEPELALLSPLETRRAAARLDELEEGIASGAPPPEVERLVERARLALAAAARIEISSRG